MNRLVQENTKNNTYSYTYDNAGNRATLTATGSENYVKSYIYDKNNRLLEECKAVNNDKYITSYQYDNNGNTIERVKSEVHLNNTSRDSLGIKTKAELPKAYSREYFKYNVFNQLSTYYSTANGKYATYKYLSNGYRCYKKVSGVETDFVWDGDEIGAEYDENGNVTNVLFRGNNLVRDGKGNNYVYDSHGSVTSILNNNGSKSKEYEYDAFGNIEKETNASTYNPWQYCGEYTDQESGFIYLRNRYYDSETGRFINEDPARSGGNWYSYCSGNPIMFWDKMGLSKINIQPGAKVTQQAKKNKEYNDQFMINDFVINGQGCGDIAKMKFGCKNLSWSGCEVIAVYNTIKLLGDSARIQDVVYYYDNGHDWANGIFGVEPKHISDLLTDSNEGYNYNVTKHEANNLSSFDNMNLNEGAYILSWRNEDGVTIHTMAIYMNSEGNLSVYNYSNGSTKTRNYESFSAMEDDNNGVKPIQLLEVKKK